MVRKSDRNKNKNVAGAPPANPISNSPPVPPKTTTISVAGASSSNPNSNSPPPSVPPPEETNIAEMEKEAIDVATAAFKKHRFDRDVAEEMTKEFDNRHGPHWHCIIGGDFGLHVTYETDCYFSFCLNDKFIVLFKCG